MNNTLSSCLLVAVILGVMAMGLMAVFYRVPVLKRLILGEGVK